MRGRQWTGLVLSVLAMPLLVLGLIDPLEGGVALLAAGATLAVTRVIGGVLLPRLTWVAWVTAAAFGAIALAGAMIRWEQERGVGPEGLPWWIVVPLIAYEIAVVLSIIGGGWYVVRHIRTLRQREEPVAGSLTR